VEKVGFNQPGVKEREEAVDDDVHISTHSLCTCTKVRLRSVIVDHSRVASRILPDRLHPICRTHLLRFLRHRYAISHFVCARN